MSQLRTALKLPHVFTWALITAHLHLELAAVVVWVCLSERRTPLFCLATAADAAPPGLTQPHPEAAATGAALFCFIPPLKTWCGVQDHHGFRDSGLTTLNPTWKHESRKELFPDWTGSNLGQLHDNGPRQRHGSRFTL